MTYIRTKEIRQKQSESMKTRHAKDAYNWHEVDNKRKQTMKEKGIRSGRKPGDGPPKRGELRSCPVCSTLVYYKPKEIETNKRKCCSRACLSQDPVYKEKLSSVDKSYLKTEEYRSTLRKPTTRAYRLYRNNVAVLTERTYVQHIDDINPQRYPRTIAGVDGGYQLDHIKPVRECFENGVDPEEAASLQNLRMLPWRENLARNKRGNNF